jgi:3-oxoacyl-[acyl-carrier protein] reductase
MSASKLNRNVVVFGATGGIGSRLARELAANGSRLFLSGRNAGKLRQLADELNAGSQPADATDSAQVRTVFDAARQHLDTLDGVVHCVGSLLLRPANRTTDAEWLDTINTHLSSAFYVLREAVGDLAKQGGAIVLLSSAAARHGFANHEAIAAAKAGIIGLTLSAAATCARQRIRVNCVAPGLTRTPLTAGLTGNETMLKNSAAMHALGRIGEPEEVAAAIRFLLESEWITGQVLGIDGGLSSVFPRVS